MSDSESDTPEEVTAQQGLQQFEEIIQAQKENKARVVREGKERRRKWAENLTPRQRSRKDESVVDVVESEPNIEVQDKKGMLPDDIVKLIASQEKNVKVFSSDSEEEESLKKLKSKKKQKKSGDGPIILNEVPPSHCLQNSLEFINKRRMQVPRSSAVLKNLKKAPRLVSSKGSLNKIVEHNRASSDAMFDKPISTRSNTGLSDRSSNQDSSPTGVSWDESSPLTRSPWHCRFNDQCDGYSYTGLMGSLVREEGSIYSLATSGDLLYTGSDSKNIRVWKNQKEFSSFKSNSGLVKAIIIAGEKIFTGHQDGKIRVWKVSSKNPNIHKRVGTLPKMRAYLKSSINPANYVDSRKNSKSSVWLKHMDAISSLSLSEDRNFLYSASWDKTIKVWRASDFKCLETINAHDDAVNSVVIGFDGLVFSGSADGSVKVWRRETHGKGTKHYFSQTLLKQEFAVTALSAAAFNLYCGSSDGLVNFWERERGLAHGGVLRGHKLAILCIATLRNLIFSGSADNNICVWRRDEGNHMCLSVLNGHTGPVKCLAVEENEGQDGNLEQQLIVYSGSLDKSVKIWRVSVEVPTKQEQYALTDGFFP